MSKLRKFISYNFPWEVSQRCASTKQVNNSFFFFANPCFYLFIYLFYCSSTVVSIFNRPWRPSPPIPASHPRTYPLWLCPCVLHTCSLRTFPYFPYYPCLPSHLVTVSLFFISISLVGAATVENSMEFPQKTKNGTAF